jgi:two-component system chemotaxis response regulator CheB
MAVRNVIVVGASAGGIEVLKVVVRSLPADLDAAMFVVVHIAPHSPPVLASILQRHTMLSVVSAEDGAAIRAGTITVGVPDHHLLLEPTRIRLTRGPRENRSRPSIDVLFRSAAQAHSTRVIGTVLTGNLDDGTAGLWWIRDRGGIAIVQQPESAEFPSMPRNALRYAGADHVVEPNAIGPLLAELSRARAQRPESAPDPELELQVAVAAQERDSSIRLAAGAEPSPYACPECHGVLFRSRSAGIPAFRCHTGHAYSIGSLLAELSSRAEDAQWNALRAMEEEAFVLKELAARPDLPEGADLRAKLEEQAELSAARVERLRSVIFERRDAPLDASE